MDKINLPKEWNAWEIEEIIGEGSFGTVYKAKRVLNGREFYSAIKVLTIPDQDHYIDGLRFGMQNDVELESYLQSVVDDYLSEITLMDKLKGITNIVSIEDFTYERVPGKIAWNIYIRMELLQSFKNYASSHVLDEKTVIQLGIDICEAIKEYASKNIIHRDIKPDNIFVSSQGHFKLGDFGVAKLIESQTGTLSKKGTYSFMAPEVAKQESYDIRSDLYSLGLVLYKLMNEKRRDPFVNTEKLLISAKDIELGLRKRMEGETFPPPSDASKSFANVIIRSCMFDPEDRYSNAEQMQTALRNLLSESPPDEEKSSEPSKEITTEKRRLNGIYLLLPIVILIGILLLWGKMKGNNLPDSNIRSQNLSEIETVIKTDAKAELPKHAKTEDALKEQDSNTEDLLEINIGSAIGTIESNGTVQILVWKPTLTRILCEAFNTQADDERIQMILLNLTKEHFYVSKYEDLKKGDSYTVSYMPDEQFKKLCEQTGINIIYKKVSKAYQG